MAAAVDTLTEEMAQMGLSTKMLILFDVNGVMFTKIDKTSDRSQLDPADIIPTNDRYDTVVNRKIKDTIIKLASTHSVGIYSSTNYGNLIKTITAIFGKRHPFVFIADRPYTSLDPRYGPDHPDVKVFDTVKPLTNIWSNPRLNEDRKWGPTNTILIDNDPRKLECNDPANVLLVPEFTLESYVAGSVPDLGPIVEAFISKKRSG